MKLDLLTYRRYNESCSNGAYLSEGGIENDR